MKKFNLEKFEGLVKFFDLGCVVLIILGYIGIFVCTIVSIALSVPHLRDAIINLSPNGNLLNVILPYELGTVSFEIATSIYNIGKVLPYIVYFCLASIVALILSIIQLKYYRKICKNVLEKKPFCLDNIQFLKKVSYLTIVLGIYNQIIMNIFSYQSFNILGLYLALMSSEYISNVGYYIKINIRFIVVAFFILLVTKIFEYGLYLQEEVDSTL